MFEVNEENHIHLNYGLEIVNLNCGEEIEEFIGNRVTGKKI